MINLQIFFKNHFDTQFISDDNMRKFADNHLQRLVVNNPGGIYTPIITDTGIAIYITKILKHNSYCFMFNKFYKNISFSMTKTLNCKTFTFCITLKKL